MGDDLRMVDRTEDRTGEQDRDADLDRGGTVTPPQHDEREDREDGDDGARQGDGGAGASSGRVVLHPAIVRQSAPWRAA
jgi:hypothetical protein